MPIKKTEIIISPEDSFKDCKLGRKPYAEILTNIIDTYSDGFVLTINNEWGTGKTTLPKCGSNI
jgi:predicted KAP-like P-loop ATPase